MGKILEKLKFLKFFKKCDGIQKKKTKYYINKMCNKTVFGKKRTSI